MSKKKTLKNLKKQRVKQNALLTTLLGILLLIAAGLLWWLIKPQKEEDSHIQPAESLQRESFIEESAAPEESSLGSSNSVQMESQADSQAESQTESQIESKEESQAESKGNSSSQESQGESSDVDTSCFDDAVFIGDSRTQGLQTATGLTNAVFLAERSMAVNKCDTKQVFRLSNGQKGTMYQALAQGQYGKVFIMFGVNELGWPSPSAFAQEYGKVIEEVRRIQPGATIYVQSILPITKARSDKDSIYNNKNVNAFNAEVEKMTREKGVIYLDVASVLRDDTGALFADAATDGVHLNPAYCRIWLKFLTENLR